MRYIKVKSLPPRDIWVDSDVLMLHSCFSILEECVDVEKVDTHCNYDANKDFVDEVRYLYNWWQERKKTIHVPDEDEEIDDEMLMRLMKIRRGLWT